MDSNIMKRTHYEQQKHKIFMYMYTRLAHIHSTPISHLTPVQKQGDIHK